jgi:hypothetical protein
MDGSPIRKFGADPGAVIAISVNADSAKLKMGNLRGEIFEWDSDSKAGQGDRWTG